MRSSLWLHVQLLALHWVAATRVVYRATPAPLLVGRRVARRSVCQMLEEERIPVEEGEPCNVVLTHTNADFDSLAGAVALARLWSVERPEVPTHVVMPRGVNPLVARFLAFHKHLYPIRGFATIRAEDVRAVGIVDTTVANRLGPAAAWLETAEHITVFDHHPASSTAGADIKWDEINIEPVGSVTTVLVERLRELLDAGGRPKSSADVPETATRSSAPTLQLSEADATLFSLGIRADTGALSFPSTTPRDGHALITSGTGSKPEPKPEPKPLTHVLPQTRPQACARLPDGARCLTRSNRGVWAGTALGDAARPPRFSDGLC